jgi:flavin reductase (DIM6/NTAB) family NADH-FMN oxidoreductase RutF
MLTSITDERGRNARGAFVVDHPFTFIHLLMPYGILIFIILLPRLFAKIPYSQEMYIKIHSTKLNVIQSIVDYITSKSKHSLQKPIMLQLGEQTYPHISPEQFRDALRHFPAGVTVVTIKSGRDLHGLTVSAFASVSPTPPLILVVIDHRGRGYELLERSNAVFAVNILQENQQHISNRFAFSEEDRFALGNWSTAVTGAPILQNALAWLDCTIYSRHSAGTHTIYIGEVQASQVPQPEERPLVYWNRAYREICDPATE